MSGDHGLYIFLFLTIIVFAYFLGNELGLPPVLIKFYILSAFLYLFLSSLLFAVFGAYFISSPRLLFLEFLKALKSRVGGGIKESYKEIIFFLDRPLVFDPFLQWIISIVSEEELQVKVLLLCTLHSDKRISFSFFE